ncbi:MAG: hypothetical protein ACC656_01480 [Candidatus Heimdallarchaeota archaeon]
MYLGIDTCTWLKFFKYENHFKIILDLLLESFNIFVTHDVLEECKFHAPKKAELFKFVEIKPRLNKSFSHYKSLGFDDADASLLEYADLNSFSNKEVAKTYTIITEDPEMLSQNILGSNRVIKLIDWILKMYEGELVTKKQVTGLSKLLYSNRNITKRKLKLVNSWLNPVD